MNSMLPKLAHTFQVPELLTQALTHKSFRNEEAHVAGDNERLEFLGDAVLDLAVTDILMREFLDANEGSLSKRRASLVNEEALAAIARRLEVDKCLRLGKGERLTGGVDKPRLLASCLEAIVGAIYLDGGFAASLKAVSELFAEDVAAQRAQPEYVSDYKTRLQEKAQDQLKTTPTYHVTEESGPDHEKNFVVEVRVGERVLGSGGGRSKKAAEQEAAKTALEKL